MTVGKLSAANHSTEVQQVLQACERQLQDAKNFNYDFDFRKPFVAGAATFTPIYHGQSEGCVLSILYNMLCSSHTRKYLPYM